MRISILIRGLFTTKVIALAKESRRIQGLKDRTDRPPVLTVIQRLPDKVVL
jgi:hypothetical protein